VFHRNGTPIKFLYGAWRRACKAAGFPGMLLHDFRRTADRNLERAGVPRSSAMSMTGHLTESVYRRYALVDTTMLKEGGAKLQTFHSTHNQTSPSDQATGHVIPLPRSKQKSS
jgi:integrase